VTFPDMTGPMLETKLYIPKLRRGVVGRPRLIDRLRRGIDGKLTLISAPAGFGKTTLLAEWLAVTSDDARPSAWLSIDPSDNQPTTFWSYVIAALQTVAPGVGLASVPLLRAPQPPPIESVLAALVNELSATSAPSVVVLDDYHLIEAREIHEGVRFLLDHLPPHVHVVIATRADPGFPLAGLRARGELAEIRAGDLRFTADEAVIYLNEVMGLDLTSADVVALEARTEGWIAALQLAALSMQGRSDAAEFIAGFAGDDRYIVDYLVEEVLQRQAEPVRQFLLRTSILARLSGPSSDAVTGEVGGKAMLEQLDRGNLFLVPLDDRREWYRYHHLFADVLLARLIDEQSDLVPDLHRRASAWYEQHDEPPEAIRHALLAGDVEHAADLMEEAMPAMRSSRQEAAMLGWLRDLPDELIASRPVLSVHYAGLLLDSGQLEGAEGHLRDVEKWLANAADTDTPPRARSSRPTIANEAEFRRLPGAIAVYRAAQAHLRGDVAATTSYATRALELIDPDDHLGRGSAAGLLALAHWTTGDLEAAHDAWFDAMTNLESAGHLTDAVGCAIALADIRIEQGRLRDAMHTYQRGLRLATEQRSTPLRGAADMHVGMSERFLERDDLDAAVRHLMISKEMGEHLGSRQNPYRWCVAMARTRVAEGDEAGALALLDDAERLYVADFYPRVRPVAALRARVWIDAGRLGDARDWARGEGLSDQDEPDYVRAFEHVTLARLLLAESKRDRTGESLTSALALLDRLLDAAVEGGRMGGAIEVLVLETLAHRMRGDVEAALMALGRALALAEPEGYIRVFLEAGPPIAALLGSLHDRGISSSYVRELLAAFGRGVDGPPVDQDLVEPLSDRELQVLRLLATDLDGPGIARELGVSLSTIRSHTKAIYAKLGVTSRRAAVSRGDELGLPSRAERPGRRTSTDA